MGKSSSILTGSLNSYEDEIESARLRKRTIITHLCFLALYVVVFGLEFTYRDALFKLSIEQQIALQPNITDLGVFVFRALSMWGDGGPYFLTFYIIFIISNRPRAFYYIMFLTSCAFLMNIMKMAYHEPRPFMYTT